MSDVARVTAFDGAAPADERNDALGQLQAAHMPSAADLMPMEMVSRFMEQAQNDLAAGSMLKSINPNVVPFPSRRSRAGEGGMQSVAIDETQINIQGEYWERPSAFSFDTMRTMVEKTPILNAVIMTRIRQVQRFCRVSDSHSGLPGFEICHVDRAHRLTKAEQEQIKLMQRFFTNSGWEAKPRLRKALRRDAFSQFMAKSVRDSLTMDSTGIELEWKRDMSLGIDGFYAVDGATIRLCSERGYQGDDEIFALQVVQGQIATAYGYEDLIYEPRNARTDVLSAGYGISETELLVRVVTGFLNAMTANIKGFDSNQIPKGMLHLTGDYTDKDIIAFKRLWNAQVEGVSNAWRLPVMVSKNQESKAAFERFGVEFNEMYFSKWMTFLVSIICAIHGMSPSEINFDSFSGGNSSPLSGSDTSEKLAASKDSGLRPLLSSYENLFSDFIVGEFSENFVFRWTGLDPVDAQMALDRKKLTMTVNEMRAEDGQPPMAGPLGDAPLNPSLVSPWLQLTQQVAPPGPDGQPGEPDAPGAEGEDGAQQGKDGEDNGAKPGDGDADGDPGQQGPDFGTPPEADFGKSFGLPIFSLTETA